MCCYGLIRLGVCMSRRSTLPESIIDAAGFLTLCGLDASPRDVIFEPITPPMQALDVLVFKMPGTEEIRHLGCALDAENASRTVGFATNGVAVGQLSRGPWRKLLRAIVRRRDSNESA